MDTAGAHDLWLSPPSLAVAMEEAASLQVRAILSHAPQCGSPAVWVPFTLTISLTLTQGLAVACGTETPPHRVVLG